MLLLGLGFLLQLVITFYETTQRGLRRDAKWHEKVTAFF